MDQGRWMRCRVCGQAPSTDARFCARCGARLPKPPPVSPPKRDPPEVEPPTDEEK